MTVKRKIIAMKRIMTVTHSLGDLLPRARVSEEALMRIQKFAQIHQFTMGCQTWLARRCHFEWTRDVHVIIGP